MVYNNFIVNKGPRGAKTTDSNPSNGFNNPLTFEETKIDLGRKPDESANGVEDTKVKQENEIVIDSEDIIIEETAEGFEGTKKKLESKGRERNYFEAMECFGPGRIGNCYW